jgi:DNA polymerase-3 subunit gamma/tau
MTLLRLFAFRPDNVPAGSGRSRAAAPTASITAAPAATPSNGGVSPELTLAPASSPARPKAGADWHDLVGRMSLSGLTRQLAQHCELAEMAETQVTLRLPRVSRCSTPKPQDKLRPNCRPSWARLSG